MKYLHAVQLLECPRDLNHDLPDVGLVEVVLLLLVIGDLAVQIAIICKLHDDAA